MTRSVPEWIGASPDTPVPTRVKVRVFERHHGRCHWSGTKIEAGMAWDVDHIVALINGGKNRESNLAPILRGKAHRAKTARDVAIKSKTARMRQRHLGIRKPSRMPGSRNSPWKMKLDGSVVRR